MWQPLRRAAEAEALQELKEEESLERLLAAGGQETNQRLGQFKIQALHPCASAQVQCFQSFLSLHYSLLSGSSSLDYELPDTPIYY